MTLEFAKTQVSAASGVPAPSNFGLAPLAVTHRYSWTFCLWPEQFQIDALMFVKGSDEVSWQQFWGC